MVSTRWRWWRRRRWSTLGRCTGSRRPSTSPPARSTSSGSPSTSRTATWSSAAGPTTGIRWVVCWPNEIQFHECTWKVPSGIVSGIKASIHIHFLSTCMYFVYGNGCICQALEGNAMQRVAWILPSRSVGPIPPVLSSRTQWKKQILSFPLTRMVPIFKEYTAFHLICILEYFPAPICHEISENYLYL